MSRCKKDVRWEMYKRALEMYNYNEINKTVKRYYTLWKSQK